MTGEAIAETIRAAHTQQAMPEIQVVSDPDTLPAGTLRILIYARVSKGRGKVGESISRQIESLTSWAGREGWLIVNIITETGSASLHARTLRTEWPLVLDAIRAGQVDVLLTWEGSRANRDLEGFVELRRAIIDARVRWGYAGRIYDPRLSSDRRAMGYQAVGDEGAADETAERLRSQVARQAERGWVHGPYLYGYQRVRDTLTGKLVEVIPHPEQAPIVREIFARYAAGESAWGIAADLNRRGVPSRTSRTSGWSAVAVKDVAIGRPAYAGFRSWSPTYEVDEYGREMVPGRDPADIGKRPKWQKRILWDVETIWPALVDPVAWREQYEKQQAQPLPPPDAREPKHLLSLIVQCVCGTPMVSGWSTLDKIDPATGQRGKYRNYFCHQKPGQGHAGHARIKADLVDAAVVRLILGRMATADARRGVLVSLAGVNDPAAEQRRTRIEEDIAGLERAIEDAEEYSRQTGRYDAARQAFATHNPRIVALRAELDQLTQHTDPALTSLAHADDPEAWWNAAALVERRAVVRGMLTVTVLPAGGPGRYSEARQLARIKPEWKV